MSDEIRIERGIEIPKAGGRWGNILSRMNVGDSFEMDKPMFDLIRTSSFHYAKKYGVKFTIRKVDGQRYRIWRIQ